MKTKLLGYFIEGIIISLLNLALLSLVNEHHRSYFEIDKDVAVPWELLLIASAFSFSYLLTKIKRIEGKSKWLLVSIYSIIPLLVDLAFRRNGDIEFEDYDSPLWIFLIIMVAWTVLRYEVDEIIKRK